MSTSQGREVEVAIHSEVGSHQHHRLWCRLWPGLSDDTQCRDVHTQ